MQGQNANRRTDVLIAAVLPVATFAVYLLSNPSSGSAYDYTFRIAGALLEGRLGLTAPPPDWLNEMIPHGERYFSAFPLGSVLSMLPAALLKRVGLLTEFPGRLIAALTAAVAASLFHRLAAHYTTDRTRRIAMTIFPLFGTWMWANLAFAGAWHIALGLAVVGQLGALCSVIVWRRPTLAGAFFALAFGNRTEILLTAPLFIWLILREEQTRSSRWQSLDRFLSVPIALGISTLLYNYLRFGSILDFGYARIPGVLAEPWYRHGIFSIHAIPGNIKAMILETWRSRDSFPWLIPSGFGGSIFLQSPFLIFIFGRNARDRSLKLAAWLAIIILTLVLWLHGNPGGWQISYRYAIELFPWIALIMLESRPDRVTAGEWIALAASVVINAWATYWFLWAAVGGK